MANPILQNLNRPNRGGLAGRLSEIRQLMAGQTPQALYSHMLQSNPSFASFVRQNQGKSPEQLASEYGLDLGLFRSIFR